MQKCNVNFLLIWFVLVLTIQFTVGFKSLGGQFDLNNRLNIRDSVLPVSQIDDPERINDQILILFVDGMRYDKMLEANTPNMDKLIVNGTVFSNFRSELPSYSLVNYAAFSAGSTTNITNVFANGYNKQLEIPTLYSLIDSTDLNKSLITGGDSWIRFIGNYSDVVVKVESEYHSLKEGEAVRKAVFATIPGNFSKVQFIGFEDVDAAGHEFGAASDVYIDTIETIDGYIGEILDLYDSLDQLENTTIVLFSDHGHANIGGHGGESSDQTHVTLVLSGKGVRYKGLTFSDRTSINAVTPTLLSILGIPLAPTMNGKVLSELVDTSESTKAIYAIQKAEIMNQQFNASINLINSLSASAKENYHLEVLNIKLRINEAKNDYGIANYSSAYDKGEFAEKYARFYLRTLYLQLNSILRLTKSLLFLGLTAVCLFIFFYLNRKGIIDIGHQKVFKRTLILQQLLGAFIAISLANIIMISFGADFSATSFNSVSQIVPPILISFFVSAFVAIFLPWLFVFLLNRKEGEKNTFKDWKKQFIRSSVGSLFFVSLPVIGYILYAIIGFGPWPSWIIPPIGDIYAIMIISILPGLLYIVAIILMLVLWKNERKAKSADGAV